LGFEEIDMEDFSRRDASYVSRPSRRDHCGARAAPPV